MTTRNKSIKRFSKKINKHNQLKGKTLYQNQKGSGFWSNLRGSRALKQGKFDELSKPKSLTFTIGKQGSWFNKGPKSKLKFKGNKLKIITKGSDGHKIVKRYNFNNTSNAKKELIIKLKAAKSRADRKQILTEFANNVNKGKKGVSIKSYTEYGNKKWGIRNKRNKKTKITYLKNTTGDMKPRIDKFSTKSNGIKTTTEYKYDNSDSSKLISEKLKIKNHNKFGSRFGRGSRTVTSDYNNKRNLKSVTRSRGLLRKSEKTNFYRDESGNVKRMTIGKWRNKSISSLDKDNHDKELTRYGIKNLLNDSNYDYNIEKLKKGGITNPEKVLYRMKKRQRLINYMDNKDKDYVKNRLKNTTFKNKNKNKTINTIYSNKTQAETNLIKQAENNLRKQQTLITNQVHRNNILNQNQKQESSV